MSTGNRRYAAPTRCLPPNPSLEQLRKQAKDLLAQYRAGDLSAAAEVQKFEHRPDPAAFALHDAQRVLARAYGFESWPKLKAFVDGVTIARFGEAARSGDLGQIRDMLAARPELAGMDMAENDEHRALHFAVLRRDLPMVRLLMQSGADARQGIWPHRDATTALALARDREYRDVVAILEEEEEQRRKSVSCPNSTISPRQDQVTAAISQGDIAAAMELLEAEPSLIHACDRNGATPLHVAAEEGNTALVAWLLQRRAGAGKQDLRGWTPLDRATLAAHPQNPVVAQQFPAIAKLLVEHGAEITIRGAVALADQARVHSLIGANPALLRQISGSGGLVTLAVKHGQRDMVRLLLDRGADVDERIVLENVEEPVESWGMPLWHAALAGNLEITRLLLDRGADPNANVYASNWPLRNAWPLQDQSVKRLLLERGAKPQPYMVAETHDIEEAKRLLAAGPSDEVVRELLWSACDHGCPEIVEMALPRLAKPLDERGWHWVLMQPIRGAGADSAGNEGHFRAMAAVLRHGVDPNVRRFGQTPLHFAAAHHGRVSDEDRARFAAMLLDYGARLDLRDDLLQSTPLGWACRWGRPKLARLLLDCGATADERGAEPWATPIAWARKMKRDAVLAVLQERLA